MLETSALQAFLSVAKNLSFSQAADELHLTQPAVSKRIAALERQLSATLFDRIGRQVQLTETGKRLLPQARQILMDLEEMRRSADEAGQPIAGQLTLGTSHHIGLHRLPPVLRRFIHLYPEVHLDLHFMDSEQVYRGVIQGELEIGMATLPPGPTHEPGQISVWHDELCIAVNHEHPLAGRQEIDLQELQSYPAILPAPNTFTHQIIERLFEDRQLHIRLAMTTNYLETLHMMVEVGLGWSVLPVSMTGQGVTPLFIRGHSLSRQLGALYHPRRVLSRAAQALLLILPSSTAEN